MYIPEHFKETRPEVLTALIAANPLGVLITHDAATGLDANHLPFEYEPAAPGATGAGVLRAHVARNNDVWQRCRDGADVLVVFRGLETYLSPNGYPSKHETHRQVPTWNYEVVHAHGRLQVRDDERYLRGLVARLTRRHEATEARPWRMGDAPSDYLDDMLRQIVGLEITVTALEGKIKRSQNKSAADRAGAADHLEAQGKPEAAAWMRQPD